MLVTVINAPVFYVAVPVPLWFRPFWLKHAALVHDTVVFKSSFLLAVHVLQVLLSQSSLHFFASLAQALGFALEVAI